jgi:two-component system sensor histidine kinase PilS (NtrC family)
VLISRRTFVDPGASFWTSLRYFCVTRLVIAAVLLGASLYGGERVAVGTQDPGLFARTAVTYAVLAATFGYLAATRQRHFYLQLAAQLLIDVVGLTLLMSASGGTRSGLALLMLLPIAGSAILSPASLAIGFAAVCSLAILAETVWRELRYDEPSSALVLAGLFGAASFAIAIVMNRLAARLIVQERIARQRGYDLRAQIEINRLVVADMQDGVLILAADGTPRAANPAALRMLALDDARALVLDGWRGHAGGTAISRQFVAWRSSVGTIGGSFDLTSQIAGARGGDAGDSDGGHEDGSGRRLRVRFVAPEGDALASGRYVVFLEDLLRVEQRAQQLKLAAMGRLTASIAHEIRNPLAAISHAGALLEEETGEALGPDAIRRDPSDARRMVTIVRENAQRLNRIVEEILQLSRRAPVNIESIVLDPWLDRLIEEFCRAQGCARETIALTIRRAPTIHFNGEHLRQVLVNLLSNAVRYASGREGTVTLTAHVLSNARSLNATALSLDAPGQERGEDSQAMIERIELVVQDDGPGIDSATRANLFEPFFTTHHRGTGLGLYLARELCLANNATLDYSANAGGTRRGGFVIRAAGTVAGAAPEITARQKKA